MMAKRQLNNTKGSEERRDEKACISGPSPLDITACMSKQIVTPIQQYLIPVVM